MYVPISPTRRTSERTCSANSSSTLTRSSSTSWRISFKSMSSRRGARSVVVMQLAVVGELHVDAQVGLLEELHDGLQVVEALARDAHLVGLDGGLHLELAALDQLHDLARVVGRDAFLHR